MRNLILLIKRFYHFFIFLFLQIICWIIVFSNNTYQQSSYLNSSRSIAGKLFGQKARWYGYIQLSELNDSLIKENARLRNQLGHQVKSNPLQDTSYSITSEKDSIRTTIYYKYIPAKVLNNSIDQKRNYITLNKGSLHGIKPRMAVISEGGIVGRVSHVNAHYSVVNSILSNKSQVSVQLPDGTVGRMVWDNQNPEILNLRSIPQSLRLKKGDSIVTSSYSYFPENILVGKVLKQNNTEYLIHSATNFRKLHYVYVIEDVTSIERYIFEDSVREVENHE